MVNYNIWFVESRRKGKEVGRVKKGKNKLEIINFFHPFSYKTVYQKKPRRAEL